MFSVKSLMKVAQLVCALSPWARCEFMGLFADYARTAWASLGASVSVVWFFGFSFSVEFGGNKRMISSVS